MFYNSNYRITNTRKHGLKPFDWEISPDEKRRLKRAKRKAKTKRRKKNKNPKTHRNGKK